MTEIRMGELADALAQKVAESTASGVEYADALDGVIAILQQHQAAAAQENVAAPQPDGVTEPVTEWSVDPVI